MDTLPKHDYLLFDDNIRAQSHQNGSIFFVGIDSQELMSTE